LRPALYFIANFTAGPTDSLQLPGALLPRLLSNPDAPNYDYLIAYENEGYLPLLFAPEMEERAPPGHRFGANIRSAYFRLAGYRVTEQRLAEWKVMEAAEANSGYIIHPEEILAEHFALLLGGAEVDNPEELEELRRLLQEGGN